MQEFLCDFRSATGMTVEFVSALGQRVGDQEISPLCALLRKSTGGCRLCSATIQQVLERATDATIQGQCDVGMCESAIPMRAGGQTLGYLLIGGYFTKPPDQVEQNRIRHVMERLGTRVDQDTIRQACSNVPLVDESRQAALIRILEFATRHLALEVTDHLIAPPAQLPRLVRTVCNQARRTFKGEVSLREIARRAGVTTEHLCRVFHHATGLRFREYVGRLRAEHARELLLATDRSVIEIAFASGFQSVSQFNRVFRAVHGASPQRIRKSSSSPISA